MSPRLFRPIVAGLFALACGASPGVTEPPVTPMTVAVPAVDAPVAPPPFTLSDITYDALEEQHRQLQAGSSVASRAVGACEAPTATGFEAALTVHIEDGRVHEAVFAGAVPDALKDCVLSLVKATSYDPSTSGTWRATLRRGPKGSD